MRRFLAAALLVLSAPVAFAADGQSTEASVHELLEAMHAHQTLDNMMGMLDNSMRAALKGALGDRQPTADEQKYFDEMQAKLLATLKSELSWEQMEPMYVDIYTTNLTQDEIDGLVTFLHSPAGIAYVDKMPVVMQAIMQKMQARVGPLMAKLQQQQRAMVEDMMAKRHAAEAGH
jgi:hypothetical protein